VIAGSEGVVDGMGGCDGAAAGAAVARLESAAVELDLKSAADDTLGLPLFSSSSFFCKYTQAARRPTKTAEPPKKEG